MFCAGHKTKNPLPRFVSLDRADVEKSVVSEFEWWPRHAAKRRHEADLADDEHVALIYRQSAARAEKFAKKLDTRLRDVWPPETITEKVR
jgi:hypothetical protein